MPKQLEIQAIIESLKKENENETIEGELLKRKLIRQLYKELGKPEEEDFPDEYKIAGRCWKKHKGYTTYIEIKTEGEMYYKNNEVTNWHIERPSETKKRIVDDYICAGWHCEVQAYNVLCTKYVKHPKYENIWVEFYSSRDCNKYSYVIED